MNDQRDPAAVATEKNVEFSKESADPYVQDLFHSLFFYRVNCKGPLAQTDFGLDHRRI